MLCRVGIKTKIETTITTNLTAIVTATMRDVEAVIAIKRSVIPAIIALVVIAKTMIILNIIPLEERTFRGIIDLLVTVRKIIHREPEA